MSRHSSAQLGELAVEYELKASAVLALRYAVEQYSKVHRSVVVEPASPVRVSSVRV